MQSIAEIRRNNLAALIERYGGVPKLARESGIPESYLRNIKGAQMRKDGSVINMGNRVARQLEERLNLRRGSMDTPDLGESLPREARERITRETVVRDIETIYHVDHDTAESWSRVLDIMAKEHARQSVKKPKVEDLKSVQKKSRKRAG